MTIGDLAPKLDFFTCDDLKAYSINKDKEVDFIAFCAQHISALRKVKRNGTADNHWTIRKQLNGLFQKGKRFNRRDKLRNTKLEWKGSFTSVNVYTVPDAALYRSRKYE